MCQRIFCSIQMIRHNFLQEPNAALLNVFGGPISALEAAPFTILKHQKMSTFKTSGIIEIGGSEYSWCIRHWSGASSMYENFRGPSVSVCLAPGKFRELIVEFPFSDYPFTKPKSHPEFVARIRSSIESAIESGWDPNSRGKPWVYSVPKNA